MKPRIPRYTARPTFTAKDRRHLRIIAEIVAFSESDPQTHHPTAQPRPDDAEDPAWRGLNPELTSIR